MYTPQTATPSIWQEEQGVWAPRAHQRVIAKLIGGLAPLYYQAGTLKLEPLPETMLDEGKISQVPDLILYDNETDQTQVIIEVCHTNGLKDDLQKVIQLIDADLYGILEGFVYNYRTNQWLRYRKGDGGHTEATSFSSVLNLDLNTLL